jgi:hypothetical protein
MTAMAEGHAVADAAASDNRATWDTTVALVACPKRRAYHSPYINETVAKAWFPVALHSGAPIWPPIHLAAVQKATT